MQSLIACPCLVCGDAWWIEKARKDYFIALLPDYNISNLSLFHCVISIREKSRETVHSQGITMVSYIVSYSLLRVGMNYGRLETCRYSEDVKTSRCQYTRFFIVSSNRPWLVAFEVEASIFITPFIVICAKIRCKIAFHNEVRWRNLAHFPIEEMRTT